MPTIIVSKIIASRIIVSHSEGCLRLLYPELEGAEE